MALIDKDKALDAIAMYLFVNDAIRGGVKVADYKVFAESILKDVPVVDAIPRDYYEKVVSEMAKRNVETADIVRCSECESLKIYNTKELYAECRKWHIRIYPFGEDTRTHGCSWGKERVMKFYCNQYSCIRLDCPFHIAHSGYAEHYQVVECKCPKEVSYTDHTEQTERSE